MAYWKFDEGQGYVVKDATGKGHDLMMMEEPSWEVRHILQIRFVMVRNWVEWCL